jgi:predicted dehydrogenase
MSELNPVDDRLPVDDPLSLDHRPPVTVGVIGCGTISARYLQNCASWPILRVLACADLDLERARRCAQEHGIPRACSVEELLSDGGIEVVLNLTIPTAHAAITLRALEAGKHVYSEKPLAITPEDGQRILDTARAGRRVVGCAPDTFLGGALQTGRQLIDSGAIGEIVGSNAFFLNHGPEGWHPNPAFFYEPGAGPLFDVGIYYLTALTSLLGPVRRVAGAGRISFPERVIAEGPLRGTAIPVLTPTYVAGILEFTGGPVGTLVSSFDVWKHTLPPIELYGTEGTMVLPDPNNFGGMIQLWTVAKGEWTEVAPAFGFTDNSRGLGLADLAVGLRTGRAPRAGGEMAYHVLEVMHTQVYGGSERGGRIESSCERPPPFEAATLGSGRPLSTSTTSV